jgi:hypothetical protein
MVRLHLSRLQGRAQSSLLATTLASVSLLALSLVAPQAQADTVFQAGEQFVVTQTFADPAGSQLGDGLFQHGLATVGFNFTGTPPVTDNPHDSNGFGQPLHAGQFTLTLTNTVTHVVSTIEAYCADIHDWLDLSTADGHNTYTLNILSGSPLGGLLTAGNDDVDNSVVNQGIKSAALQVAIWKEVNDPSNQGLFQVDAATDAGVDAQANLDLTTFTTQAPNFDVGELVAPGNQTLVFAFDPPPSRIPEPTSLVLFGLPLLGFGALRYRRKS